MQFLRELLGFFSSHQSELLKYTVEHIWLTGAALLLAVAVGVPVGIWMTRHKKIVPFALGITGTLQTIPTLALMALLLPFFGIGFAPSIIVLFIYALLPIVRNTHTGIEEVDSALKEAARGMGMTSWQVLVNVELPLAMPIIFAGIRTATVIGVGVATLCPLIGAGGLGKYIFDGIYLNNPTMILAGTIPAALLAIVLDLALGWLQKFVQHLLAPLAVTFAGIYIFAAIFLSNISFSGTESTSRFFLEYWRQILHRTGEHISLTTMAMAVAIAIGVSLGVLLSRYRKLATPVLSMVGILQTIPSVAMLGLLLPFLGIGVTPALAALFLYALLPIVRNTYIGIVEVDPAVKEAARGMGMSGWQIVARVELPLAVPIIFAGIRTATVITVGIATLSSIIGAGGLGTLILQGFKLNKGGLILAGAIPAALLALALDFLLGYLEKIVDAIIKPLLVAFAVVLFVVIPTVVVPSLYPVEFTAGMDSEFMKREDGYPGLSKHYDIQFKSQEVDPSLMYIAIKEKKVDLIVGYSTDGRVTAYNLRVLEDDKHYFPPYRVAPTIHGETLRKYPQLRETLNKLAYKLSDATMAQLNYRVDHHHESPREVARSFLQKLGYETKELALGEPAELTIGCKAFTEQYILAEMFALLIENDLNRKVDIKAGLGGTKICFDALTTGKIDIYPEYTGTALLVLLKTDKKFATSIMHDKDKVYKYVKEETKQRYDIDWLQPVGCNNTYALMMREEQAQRLKIESISDLKEYLEEEAQR